MTIDDNEFDFLASAYANDEAQDTYAREEHSRPALLTSERDSPVHFPEAHSPSGSLFSEEDSPSLEDVPEFPLDTQSATPPTWVNTSPQRGVEVKAPTSQVETTPASSAPQPATFTPPEYPINQILCFPTPNTFAPVTSEARATANDASLWSQHTVAHQPTPIVTKKHPKALPAPDIDALMSAALGVHASLWSQDTASWSTNVGKPTRSRRGPSSGKVSKGKNRVSDQIKPIKRKMAGTGNLDCPCRENYGFSRDDAQKRHIFKCKEEVCENAAVLLRLKDAYRRAKNGTLDKAQLARDIEALPRIRRTQQQNAAPPENGQQPGPSTLPPQMAPPQPQYPLYNTNTNGYPQVAVRYMQQQGPQQQVPRSLDPVHPPPGASHGQSGPFQQQYVPQRGYWAYTAVPGQAPFLAGPTAGPSNIPAPHAHNVHQPLGLRHPVPSYPIGYPQAPTGPAPHVQVPVNQTANNTRPRHDFQLVFQQQQQSPSGLVPSGPINYTGNNGNMGDNNCYDPSQMGGFLPDGFNWGNLN